MGALRYFYAFQIFSYGLKIILDLFLNFRLKHSFRLIVNNISDVVFLDKFLRNNTKKIFLMYYLLLQSRKLTYNQLLEAVNCPQDR